MPLSEGPETVYLVAADGLFWCGPDIFVASKVSCVVYSSSGAYLASGSLDGTAASLESQLVTSANMCKQKVLTYSDKALFALFK